MVGRQRGARYRQRAPGLAQLVERCWQVSPDVTVCVSEPLAYVIDRHLPESAKRGLDAGLEPVSILIAAWRILSHCTEQERHAIESYVAHQRGGGQAAQQVPVETRPVQDAGEAAQAAQSFDVIVVDGGGSS